MGLVRAVGCVISMAFFVLGRGLVSCSDYVGRVFCWMISFEFFFGISGKCEENLLILRKFFKNMGRSTLAGGPSVRPEKVNFISLWRRDSRNMAG